MPIQVVALCSVGVIRTPGPLADSNLSSFPLAGTPHPSLFPFETLSSSVLPYNAYSTDPPSLVSRSASTTFSWLQSFFVQNPDILKIKKKEITIPKYATEGGGPEEILLERALQYG